ncbi:hypothetical protein NL108_018717 [Boleophthalmus pectinirostris]|uniref:uncharacterized protein LOC110162633 n=1 Tax=Boleophthalmus pectinirostris TaxID=150288 RepID=UPI00242A6F4D|nr:uncharacterized protein LOC110162633 [Boleophthalmus pectinirostris]KAJ0037188.1 hypothetical protein NL108_018717 [Boleophthalmus pectinirostris]
MEPSAAHRALAHTSSDFIEEFNRQRSRLENLISRVGRLDSDRDQRLRQNRTHQTLGTVVCGAAAVCGIIAAPSTKGLSLGLSAAAAAGYYFYSPRYPPECDDIHRSFRATTAEIHQMVDSLRTELDTVIGALVRLQTELDGAQSEHLSSETRAPVLTGFPGDTELSEAREKFSRVLDELRENHFSSDSQVHRSLTTGDRSDEE